MKVREPCQIKMIEKYGYKIEKKLGGLSAANFHVSKNERHFVFKFSARENLAYEESRLNALNRLDLKRTRLPRFKKPGLDSEYADYAIIYQFIPGLPLHAGDFSSAMLINVGECLAEFHLLKKQMTTSDVSVLTLNNSEAAPRVTLCNDNSLVAISIDNKKKLKKKLTQNQSSISIKRNVVLVHGDFHNENMLFNESKEMIALLDLEAVTVGEKWIDLFRFIDLAISNPVYDQDAFEKCRDFIYGYRKKMELGNKELENGFYEYYIEQCNSIYFESRISLYKEGNLVPYLQRDVSKLFEISENFEKILRFFQTV